jgi:polysaccharide biosynthesis protein PelF
MLDLPKAKSFDILLLIEGSYPFVTGGVSSWVQQLIQLLPELTFGIIFLGSEPSAYTDIKYKLPKNLVHIDLYYMFDTTSHQEIKSCPGNKKAFDRMQEAHCCFRDSDTPRDISEDLHQLFNCIEKKDGITQSDFLYSRASWDAIVNMYETYSEEPSFIDYFWTIRNVPQPLWALSAIKKTDIEFKVAHTVSTGYAGFIGAALACQHKKPLILTEHGIYTKERHIQLLQTDMVKRVDPLQQSPIEPSYLRHIWMRFFSTLAIYCYDTADTILSLYSGAREKQIEDGANPKKARVVPNGIPVERFTDCHHKTDVTKPFVVALIGRVVPIKDIKTYIRAIKIAHSKTPTIEAWIVGPNDGDDDYARDCEQLVLSLGLEKVITFTGTLQLTDALKNIDLMVLSSISEGMPLTILEAYSAAIPVVVTDVGACREMVTGQLDPDNPLPAGGAVVSIADPNALSAAIIKMLTNQAVYNGYKEGALARVQTHYTETLMQKNYRDIYLKAMDAWQE